MLLFIVLALEIQYLKSKRLIRSIRNVKYYVTVYQHIKL
jgi:hypothetical protein